MSELRVLFVGNSYTFYNDMPRQVAALAEAAADPLRIVVDTVVQGGGNVQVHWEETGAPDRIRGEKWDRVVIQDLSTGPLHHRRRFEKYAGLLLTEARSGGAAPVLYQTWARKAGHPVYRSRWSGGDPETMQARIREAYREVADAHGAVVAPVGDAWEIALNRQPALPLHDTDDHHASALGSHLAALVFWGLFSGLDPRTAAWHPGEVDSDRRPDLVLAAALALGFPHDPVEGRGMRVS